MGPLFSDCRFCGPSVNGSSPLPSEYRDVRASPFFWGRALLSHCVGRGFCFTIRNARASLLFTASSTSLSMFSEVPLLMHLTLPYKKLTFSGIVFNIHTAGVLPSDSSDASSNWVKVYTVRTARTVYAST